MNKIIIIGCLAVMSLVGCDKRITKLQYAPDMADSATIKSQESILLPPENAIAMSQHIYPQDVLDAEKALKNPLELNTRNLQAGKKLWGIYCAVCHGQQGKGKMTLTSAYAAAPPDITGDAYKSRKDGFFFYRITYGAALMPAYGHSTDHFERWQIVQYLRSLQNQ